MSVLPSLLELSARALLHEVGHKSLKEFDCPSQYDESILNSVEISLDKYLSQCVSDKSSPDDLNSYFRVITMRSHSSSLLKKLSTLPKDIGSILLSEHFGRSPAPGDPNVFLLLHNVFAKAAEARTINWKRRQRFYLPKLPWVFLIRTMPATITEIKLNNLLLDADALLLALASSSNCSRLKSLKIRQSLLSEEGIKHLQAMPKLRVLDIALCPVPGALQRIATYCKKLQVIYYGWVQSFGHISVASASQNAAYDFSSLFFF
jgi:hypothetical protein